MLAPISRERWIIASSTSYAGFAGQLRSTPTMGGDCLYWVCCMARLFVLRSFIVCVFPSEFAFAESRTRIPSSFTLFYVRRSLPYFRSVSPLKEGLPHKTIYFRRRSTPHNVHFIRRSASQEVHFITQSLHLIRQFTSQDDPQSQVASPRLSATIRH